MKKLPLAKYHPYPAKPDYQICRILLIIIFLFGGHFVQKSTSQPAGQLNVVINTDNTIGTCYRFWNVRVSTNQTEFINNSAQSLRFTNPFMKTVNCVRLLGGRTDSLNQWYKGVDNKGNIIVDFSELVKIFKAILNLGYKPFIVLDNVPEAMSEGEMNFYGNCKPPKDYNVWRQYITAFMNTLVDEFGREQVKTWRFRVGTEPDLFPNHWNGTREEYFKHYDITVDAVTKVIPDVEIGPGNILNPIKNFKVNYKPEKFDKETADLIGTGQGWGVSIIDHAVTGTNYVSGEKGTRMDYFAISYYESIGGNRPIHLNESIKIVRDRLDRYPETRDIPLSIQEFGILTDEFKKRIWGNDITEWGASWYAAISDIVYQNDIKEVYEWSTTTIGIPHPRTQVMRMLDMMADGKRIDVKSNGNANGNAGIIACIKDNKVYLLLYSHPDMNRIPKMKNFISFKLQGAQIAKSKNWIMNEWSVDRDHAVWAYELYKDLDKAGIEPSPEQAIYDGNPGRRFGNKWRAVFDENRSKYEKIAEFPLTAKNKPVKQTEGVIKMDYDMPGHSVRLIELIPGK